MKAFNKSKKAPGQPPRGAADAVLSAARDNADAVLDAARDKADERRTPAIDGVDEAVLGERKVADEALQAERDSADQVLREEREEYAYAFLPIERESTDRYLRSERIRSDDAVMNRDDFLAIVTHDLRDLLGGIVLSSTVLAKRAQHDEAGASTLAETRRIARYAALMGRLIGDLMDVASIDAGKLAVAPTPGNLAVVLTEAADAFKVAAESRGIALECRIDGAPLAASFDHDRILQVLGNLISNALKHTPRGGRSRSSASTTAASCAWRWTIRGQASPKRRLRRSSSASPRLAPASAAASGWACTSRAAWSMPMAAASGRKASLARAPGCA